MKTGKIMFAFMLIAVVLIEFCFWALLTTRNHCYFLGLCLASAVLLYACRQELKRLNSRQPVVRNDYRLYFIQNNSPPEDIFYRKLKMR